MARNFAPGKFRRKEDRYKPRTKRVSISVSDEKWLDRFVGKIQFWSFGFFKVKKDTVSTKFRVYTRKRIYRDKLIPLIEAAFPEGVKVTPVVGYRYRNTFDVKIYRPIRWDHFIFEIVKALQALL